MPVTRPLLLASLIAAVLIAVVSVSDGFQAIASHESIWISPAELSLLPTTGASYKAVKAAADGSLGAADIRNPDSKHDVKTLAVALMYGRTGLTAYRTKARQAVLAAIGTERGGNSLALARNIVPYVIAADLIDLDGSDGDRFRDWIAGARSETMSDRTTMIAQSERRPNNHGTHANAARAVIAAYLDDAAELDRAAKIFKGWLGDRSSWSEFRYGDTSWQCDARAPVGINRQGCVRDGHSIDGVLPDDQRRSGTFTWPPPQENYVYEALQGAIVEAEVLSRRGYPAWSWENQALLRAFRWLHDQAGFSATGDDQWQPWLVNRRYGTRFAAVRPARHGKNMGWTDWTHGS